MSSKDPVDLARIAFVTSAYPRMRAAILSIGIGPFTIWMWRCVRQDQVARSFVALAAVFAVQAALLAPEGWLDRRFGRVRRGFTGRWRDVAPMLLAFPSSP